MNALQTQGGSGWMGDECYEQNVPIRIASSFELHREHRQELGELLVRYGRFHSSACNRKSAL